MVPRNRVLSVCVVALLLLGATGIGSGAPAPRAPDVVPDQYIVVFHDWVDRPAAEASSMAFQHGLGLLHVYEHALKGFAAVIPAARLNDLRSDARVALISEDRMVSIDAQSLPTGINRIQADVSNALSGNGTGSFATASVAVAVIDTGIDLDHPELNVLGGV